MVIYGADARQAGQFADEQQGGRKTERERSAHLQDYSITRERMRTQQHCRDYWEGRYGIEAERASRGGISWLWR